MMKGRKWLALVGLTIALSVVAEAQIPLIKSHGRKVTPLRIAPIGPDLKLRGPWRPYPQNSQTPQAASWAVAFDCYEGDATGTPTDTVYGPSVGLGSQRLFWGDLYRNCYYSNDIVLATGTGGRPAERLQAAWFWNPPLPEQMMVAVFAADDFGFTDAGPSWANGYTGVVIDYGVTAASVDYLYSDVDLKTTGDIIPLPWDGNGAVVSYLATFDQNLSFVPATVAQPMLWGTRWSGNPSYPGTNPSRSDRYHWDDDNPTDFDHGTGAATERYDYDYGPDVPPRILGSMTALLVDNNAELIGGTVTFSGVDMGTTRPIKSATFSIRAANNPNDVFSIQTVPISATGQYRLAAPQSPGSYSVSCIDSHFLRRSVGPVVTTGAAGVRTAPAMTMINGNIDGDDPGAVDIADYAILSSVYGSSMGDPGFMENADLNRDDTVDIADFAILSSNYGLEGDS
ncbi:MAG: hypothetical protein K1X67_22590 [Fimbriimonadaceae bacterium]|nr:hypothetical protein [Fimbriimonadaceae bacterium]